MTRDADRADREPEPASDAAPDHACVRDWHPAEAPEDRRGPKYEDEPIRWSSNAAGPDPDPEPEPDGEPDVGGRHG